MPQKLKVELQDENGNVYYLHTAADVVFLEDGTTVEAALEAKVTKSGGDIADTVVSAIDASSDSFPVLKENSKPRKFLGQINKWFSDCLTKFGNYILTTAISNQQINSTTNVPSSALAYLMQQAIVANQNSIGVLNTKLTNLHFLGTTLFNGEAHYNQTYQATGKLNDYELYQVTIGWRQSLCLKGWYDATHNGLVGFAVYAGDQFTDLYRYEIVFDQTGDAQNFYTQVLVRTRLYPDGRYEYNYSDVVVNNILGLKIAPRDW